MQPILFGLLCSSIFFITFLVYQLIKSKQRINELEWCIALIDAMAKDSIEKHKTYLTSEPINGIKINTLN